MGSSVQSLYDASREGDIDKVKGLIKSGVDVNGVVKFQDTAAFIASAGNHVECLRALIEAGADVKHLNIHRDTPIIVACLYGSLDCLKELIKAGANINCKNDYGLTPLYAAVNYDNIECIEELAIHGVDPDQTSRDVKPPLYYALPGVKSRILIEMGATWPPSSPRLGSAYEYYIRLRRGRLLLAFYLADMTVAAHVFSRYISCADACVSF